MSTTELLPLERRPFEGQLNKFTNLVKGWQYRWMILDPETGTLSYYTSAEDKYDASRPVRGSGHLAGAFVVPSQEDSTAFSVDFASGETFKLRASNVKERQIWVDKLRSVAQSHDKALTAVNSASPPIREYLPPTPPGSKSHLRHNGEPNEALQNLSLTVLDALASAHDILHQCNVNHKEIVKDIEKSPRSFDKDFLILKSTSQSALLCLENALLMIQDYNENMMQKIPLKSKTVSESKFSLHSPLNSPRKKQPSVSLHQDNGSCSSTPLTSSKSNTESPTKSTGSLKEPLKERISGGS